METIRKLEDGELGKYYDSTSEIVRQIKTSNNKVTVDNKGFAHSYNDEPAIIHFLTFNNKSVKHFEYWFDHGYKHRLTGATYIRYSENDILANKIYYIQGKQFTQEQWKFEVNRINMLNEI